MSSPLVYAVPVDHSRSAKLVSKSHVGKIYLFIFISKDLVNGRGDSRKGFFNKQKRYRGNSTQIRWQKIIQFAHFYSAAQTGVEFIFTLSLFMLFKHNIH